MRFGPEFVAGLRRAGLVLLAMILQFTVVPRMSVFGIQPSVVLAAFFLFAVRQGSLASTWLGFLCGTILDLYAPGAAGAYAFAMALTGYLVGLLDERAVHTEVPTRVVLLGLAILVHDLSWYWIGHRAEDTLGGFLLRSSLPSAVYTMIVGAGLFALRPTSAGARTW